MPHRETDGEDEGDGGGEKTLRERDHGRGISCERTKSRDQQTFSVPGFRLDVSITPSLRVIHVDVFVFHRKKAGASFS